MNNFEIYRQNTIFLNLGLDRYMAKFVEQAGIYLRYSRNGTSDPTVPREALARISVSVSGSAQ